MAKGKLITLELVGFVKEKAAEYPYMKQRDLAILCNTSPSTVGRILNGEYDHLGSTVVAGEDTSFEDLKASIDLLTSEVQELCAVFEDNNKLLRTCAAGIEALLKMKKEVSE